MVNILRHSFAVLIIIVIFIILVNNQSFADDKISLAMPIDCIPGKTCFTQKYVDMDASKDTRYFKCGSLSTDGHQGTDIRLLSYREMEAGVDVFAAAAGKVNDIRDKMPDVSSQLVTYDVVTNRGYGNRVAIKHDNGYMTIYAHLKRASLLGAVGDIVKSGQKLAKVGLSGLSEYPHLHFELRRGRKIIDPYSGKVSGYGCGKSGDSYWNDTAKKLLRYQPSFIINAGFSSVKLNRNAVEYQLYEDKISANSRNFLYNIYLAGISPGDKFNIKIISPDGVTPIFEGNSNFDRAYVVRHVSGGKSNREKSLPKGVYQGQFNLIRDGITILNISKKVKVN